MSNLHAEILGCDFADKLAISSLTARRQARVSAWAMLYVTQYHFIDFNLIIMPTVQAPKK